MADKKISALTASTTPLAGTEVLPIVQGGSTVKVSVANLTAGRTVSAASLDVVSSGNPLITLRGTDGAYSSIFNIQAAGGGISLINATGGSNILSLYTNTVERFRVGATGDATMVNGNLVIGTAGKGIDFSANTHAAGMTSELLNWYETGTWTGGISFGGGSTGITYANNVGYYTRIGNIVTVSCYLVLSNKGSSTGAARITGLPFTCVNNASGYSALSVLPLNVTFTGQLSGYANINDTTIDLVPSTGVALTDVGFANNSTFIISLTYRAA